MSKQAPESRPSTIVDAGSPASDSTELDQTPDVEKNSKEQVQAQEVQNEKEAAADGNAVLVPISKIRRALIFVILCSAQFFDVFNACSAIIALPSIGESLNFTPSSLQWVLSGYTLTFAAFMLASGRLADIYHPKPVFCVGYAIVGLASIPIAAGVDPIMVIVFRAIQGIGAAMNIPPAVSMISQFFPEPREQARAYAVFAAFGAVGNSGGFIIGGVIAARVSWRWVYYLLAILAIPLSALSFIILPHRRQFPSSSSSNKERTIDWLGVATLTAGLILFVYAISDASDVGWGSARIISTLIISVLLFVAFFLVERWVKDPAVPPRVWTNKNFIPLFVYAWTVYWFLFASQMALVQVFTTVWGCSALEAAVRCIPTGIVGGVTAYLTGMFSYLVPQRMLLIFGQLLMVVGAILYALADNLGKYWSHIIPGMILGMLGLALAYVGCTSVVMESARKGEEGVVGAVMYTAYQVGSTLGIAVSTSIILAVNEGQTIFKGYAASFWALCALHGIMVIVSVVFIR